MTSNRNQTMEVASTTLQYTSLLAMFPQQMITHAVRVLKLLRMTLLGMTPNVARIAYSKMFFAVEDGDQVCSFESYL